MISPISFCFWALILVLVTSVIIMIECQVDYAMNCIKYMIRNKIQAVDPKKDRQSQFVAKVRKGLEGTTWASGGCGSYYKKDGNVFAIWSGSVASYWLDLKFNPNDFNQYSLA
ncbi:hypothetical protein [Absidia glauca]|uniref:Uncharacterized protein n=1 Tax=Absidia glauca TaxID=4829 RepID=A0A168MJW8_ABSGL|nr:hypothetical protein [Absidia glauca]